MQLLDEAGDARADLDGGDGLEAPGVFVPLRDALGDRLRHRNGHCRWPALGEGGHRCEQHTGEQR